ncbi:unnamed protein product [Ostreobium quekettii]|uniref:Mitochondrial Rho GTPase n=1 Tax=Ostreobium quekettii TaxID=121088 RepID=A0A8S1IV83_9CHLO|nr:unnamed protein product [Ostreobium quekettii]|eukprot:evm.model.scf_384EXC.3 EVM.evm.TU.scf_384EXC.3   scf_384EXC:32250-39448(-)
MADAKGTGPLDREKLLYDTAKVVVLGDPGVGKSSLIAAATESFDPNPPPCLPPTRLPPQMENVPLLVTDTSSRSENSASLREVVKDVDVVLLCYAVDMMSSIQRLKDYWLPELRKLETGRPIVLCGCKMDNAPDEYSFEIQRLQLEELLKEFREIETAIECSARTLSFVQEVFHFVLKAVIHPQLPLYDTMNQKLKPRCAQALRRVFLLCDHDRDNRLSEREINAFQIACFNTPLQPDELVSVLETVGEKIPHGVKDNGLTLPGFMFLNALFMERGRFETSWQVLRRFGYTNELTLSDELIQEVSFDISPDQTMELTDRAIVFLTDWFNKLDSGKTGGVKEAKIVSEMEETTPEHIWSGPEWDSVLVANPHAGRVTLEGFLSNWRYSMLIHPKETLKQLLYLGCDSQEVVDLCTTTKRRKLERREQLSRSVLQCLVFGSKGCGKTSLLRGLVGSSAPTAQGLEAGHNYVAVASVTSPQFGERTLVLKEVGPEAASALLKQDGEGGPLEAVDVAAFVFDGNDAKSFAEAQSLMLQVSTTAGDYLPCLFVASKLDQPMAPDLKSDCAACCAELKMREPLPISAQNGEFGSLFRTLVETAVRPGPKDIPETPARKAAKIRRLWMQRLLLAGVAGVVALGVAVYVVPRMRGEGRPDGTDVARARGPGRGGRAR